MLKVELIFSETVNKDPLEEVYGIRRMLLPCVPLNGFKIKTRCGNADINITISDVEYFNKGEGFFECICEIKKPLVWDWEEFMEEVLRPDGWSIKLIKKGEDIAIVNSLKKDIKFKDGTVALTRPEWR